MADSVGQSVPRVDGAAKVTGTAPYVDDIVVPGMLYGTTVRSDIPHGELIAIHRDADFDWGDVSVVTAADIPGRNIIAFMDSNQPALVPVGGVIMHCDEPVALIAGRDRERVQQARAHIRLEVTEFPAVLDVDAALQGKACIYGDDNIFRRLEIHKCGDAALAAAFASADIIIEGTYRTGAQEQMYLETQGMIAAWEIGEGGDPEVHVRGSMQCPYFVHGALKELLALPDARVTVSQAVTGGGFGGKEEYPSMLAGHAALLTWAARAPVKMIYDREEDIGATTKRHPAVIHHRLGLRRDGTIVAIDVDVVLDAGAYITLTPVVLSRAILHAAGPYRCEHTRIVGRAVATNTPPHGAYRGFGAPQVTFAYERQMDKAARALGIDPVALRRKNMLRLGDRTATNQRLTYSVGGEQVLAAVESALERKRTHDVVPPRADAVVRRGRGWAFYNHGAGFTGQGEERLKGKVEVAVAADGHFEVRSASTDIGQGARTIFTQMAATTLGVGTDEVRVVNAHTGMVPNSGPTVASRTCMVVGSVVERAAQQLRNRLVAFATKEGLDPLRITDVAATFAARHGELKELATYASPPGIVFDDKSHLGDAYPVFGWAACAVDVAVDIDTCEVTLERLVHAVDVGKAINPVIVKGQIEGGTLQALGWALWESVLYDGGRVLNRRMTNSIIPTPIEAPEMETIIVEEPYPHGPHGAKGVGEIPMDGPAAAVANGIASALAELEGGEPPDVLPLLPEIIAQLLSGEPGRPWL